MYDVYVSVSEYTISCVIVFITKKKRRTKYAFSIVLKCSVNYIKLINASITPAPPAFEVIALPIIVPALALLFATA